MNLPSHDIERLFHKWLSGSTSPAAHSPRPGGCVRPTLLTLLGSVMLEVSQPAQSSRPHRPSVLARSVVWRMPSIERTGFRLSSLAQFLDFFLTEGVSDGHVGCVAEMPEGALDQERRQGLEILARTGRLRIAPPELDHRTGRA